MGTLSELLDDLWSTPVGRSFICNFVDGVDWHLIHPHHAIELRKQWVSLLTGSPADALGHLDAAVSIGGLALKSPVGPSKLPNAIATTFACRHILNTLRTSPSLGLSRIANLIEQFGHARSRLERERIQAELFTAIEVRAAGNPNGLIEIQLVDHLAGPMPHAWFTSYDDGDLESGCWLSRPYWERRPDAARDILGLVHRGSLPTYPSAHLPELMGTFVVTKEAVPPGTTFCRPSALDGGTHSRFKCLFGDATKPLYEWGRALNLEKLLSMGAHEGGREIVMANFLPIQKIRFTVLGQVLVPRADFLGFHDDLYEGSVRRGRAEAGLKSSFLKAVT